MTADEVMALIRASDKPHYCYILRRPDGRPFYVGIGQRRRLLNHVAQATRKIGRGRKGSIIRKILRGGGSISYEIVGFYDGWDDAVCMECELIAKFGRADKGAGPLANLTDGGEGQRGAIYSAEWRARKSAEQRGRIIPPEIRARMSAGMTGIPKSAQHRKNISLGKKGKPVSQETKDRLRALNVNKVVSRETGERISAAHRKRLRTDERIADQPQKQPRPWKYVAAEIDGLTFPSLQHAAKHYRRARRTIISWLNTGKHGARRLPKPDPA